MSRFVSSGKYRCVKCRFETGELHKIYSHWYHRYQDKLHKPLSPSGKRIKLPHKNKHYVVKNMLIIDTREGIEIKTLMEKMLIRNGIKHNYVALQAKADYLITGNMCIAVQRKTISDLINSLSTISQDMAELKREYNSFIPLLLIEGKYTLSNYIPKTIIANSRDTKLLSSSFHNLLFSLQIKGISVFNTFSIEHTIEFLVSLHKYCQKEFHSALEPALPGFTQANVVQHVYSHIPGIGDYIAKKLFEKFPTINELVKANINDLEQVEGIGKERAIKIYEWLRK